MTDEKFLELARECGAFINFSSEYVLPDTDSALTLFREIERRALEEVASAVGVRVDAEVRQGGRT